MMLRFRCLEYGHMMEEPQDASNLAKKRRNGCGSTQSRLKIMEDALNLAKTGRILCVNTVQPNTLEESDDTYHRDLAKTGPIWWIHSDLLQHEGGCLEVSTDRSHSVDPLWMQPRFVST